VQVIQDSKVGPVGNVGAHVNDGEKNGVIATVSRDGITVVWDDGSSASYGRRDVSPRPGRVIEFPTHLG